MPLKRRSNGPWVTSILGEEVEEKADVFLAAQSPPIRNEDQYDAWLASDANTMKILRAFVKQHLVVVTDIDPMGGQ